MWTIQKCTPIVLDLKLKSTDFTLGRSDSRTDKGTLIPDLYNIAREDLSSRLLFVQSETVISHLSSAETSTKKLSNVDLPFTQVNIRVSEHSDVYHKVEPVSD